MTTASDNITITIPAETGTLMRDIIAGYEAGEITASEITVQEADDTADNILREVKGSSQRVNGVPMVPMTAVCRWYAKWHGTDRNHPKTRDGAWLTEIIDAMREDLAAFPIA